ncbi:MAG: hypothetical protein JKY33_01825 [Bacteroidia bacterium]|nr:hypothetical protein [Bacteroidia bacterium]
MRTKEVYKDYFIRKFSNFCRRYRLRTPVRNIIITLQAYDIIPENAIGLDLFGRHGLWHTWDLAEICNYIEMWEIDPFYANHAKKFIPKANVQTGDSIDAVKNSKLLRNDYNIILVDNPNGPFANDQYCEHFDLFPDLLNHLTTKAVLIINLTNDVNAMNARDQYSSEFMDKWLERRKGFYGKEMNNGESIVDYMDIYKQKFTEWNWKVNECFFSARHEFVGYLVLEIEKSE